MIRTYDVIVVGVGTMGAAACYQLARRGVRVLGLEQFDVPHGRGSHHGFSRMIRMAYFEHPDYGRLLKAAYDLWFELEAESGQKMLEVTGGLYMGRPDCDLVDRSRQAAEAQDLPHEMIGRRRLADEFECFRVPDEFVAFYENKAGFILPERAVAAFAELALRGGADLRGQEPVLKWTAEPGGVTVHTSRDTYAADRIIFCGGAWSCRLLGDIGVDLTVTRQVLGWVWPHRTECFSLGRFPVWAIEPDEADPNEGIYYGFPMMPDNPGFKIALHHRAGPTDPDQVCHEIQPGDEQTFRPALRKWIPAADGPLLSLRVCLYTNSSDGHFIIDRHPLHEHVLLACGFSGHGFKFAPVIGRILADLATQDRTSLPIEFLRLDRFSLK